MTTRRGSCLCGACTFETSGDISGITQCHCSLCRKVTGSTDISIFRTTREDFRWTRGEDNLATHTHSPIYALTRCATCGSPLYYTYKGDDLWVAAGAMIDPLEAGIDTHYFCASRGDWDFDTESSKHHDEIPR